MEKEIKLKWIWISTKLWTGAFDLADNGKIVTTPPIAYRYISWDYHRLLDYLHTRGWLLDWRIYHDT